MNLINMVRLVTVATHSHGYFPWLVESCKRYKTELKVLGWGEKWQGFTWRFGLMIDYLKSLDPNEIVCFIDAYDVILLRHLNEIVSDFNNVIKLSNKKIIISQEIIDPGYFDTFNKIYFGKCKNNYICAGTYMGKASDILDLLIDAYKNQKDNNDDQVILTNYCKVHPDVFYIDTDSNFFLVIGPHSVDLTKNKNIKFTENGISYLNSRPFFFHGPGNRKMDDLIRKLNYNITDKDVYNIKTELKKVSKNKFWYYIIRVPYIKHIIGVIVLLIILFIIFRRHKILT
jgi:hypothetical protein